MLEHSALPGHTFAPVILRQYDIRGEVGKNLSDNDAWAIGLSFGTLLRRQGGKTMCVGYDGRLTSPSFAQALIDGLVKTGIAVENIGLGPTPMLYYAVKKRKADAGIMVTGSHNPASYNGFKITLQTGPFYGAMIQEIGKIAASGDFESGNGMSRTYDIRQDYISRLLQDYTGKRELKIAWDAGNGAAGEVLRLLTQKLPGKHILLYDEIDGRFPNHHPDPTVDKNLADLRKAVLDNKCDLGIAFDGDGDRIGVVDEKGDILRCDVLMTLYAQDVLAANPGAAIVGDVKCSDAMFAAIEKMGGKAVMWKTGHSLVKTRMAETNAKLGGELSGHIFFADKYYGFDDALYCAVRLINLVDATKGGLSSLTASYPKLYSTPETRCSVAEAEKFTIVPKLIENLRKQESIKLNDIDGIRVTTPDGWWLLRASNTESVLVARAESPSSEGLERLKSMLSLELSQLGYTIDFNA